MSESTYDIVILGAGSGGYATALRAAQLGMKVALIDGDKVGGTCLHRGCIPTKAYLHAAETAEAVRESSKFGVSSTFNGIDMAQVGKYRDSVISGLYKGLQGLLKSRNVEVISGWGRLADANTIEVNGERITGRNIVLATGSYSRSIPGLDIGGRVISSDQALQMDWVPSSAVILGGVQVRLRGDAAAVQAGAAHLIAVDEGDCHAQLRGAQGGRVAAGTRTQNDDVVGRFAQGR